LVVGEVDGTRLEFDRQVDLAAVVASARGNGAGERDAIERRSVPHVPPGLLERGRRWVEGDGARRGRARGARSHPSRARAATARGAQVRASDLGDASGAAVETRSTSGAGGAGEAETHATRDPKRGSNAGRARRSPPGETTSRTSVRPPARPAAVRDPFDDDLGDVLGACFLEEGNSDTERVSGEATTEASSDARPQSVWAASRAAVMGRGGGALGGLATLLAGMGGSPRGRKASSPAGPRGRQRWPFPRTARRYRAGNFASAPSRSKWRSGPSGGKGRGVRVELSGPAVADGLVQGGDATLSGTTAPLRVDPAAGGALVASFPDVPLAEGVILPLEPKTKTEEDREDAEDALDRTHLPLRMTLHARRAGSGLLTLLVRPLLSSAGPLKWTRPLTIA
jgi:hypothetical protein